MPEDDVASLARKFQRWDVSDHLVAGLIVGFLTIGIPPVTVSGGIVRVQTTVRSGPDRKAPAVRGHIAHEDHGGQLPCRAVGVRVQPAFDIRNTIQPRFAKRRVNGYRPDLFKLRNLRFCNYIPRLLT